MKGVRASPGLQASSSGPGARGGGEGEAAAAARAATELRGRREGEGEEEEEEVEEGEEEVERSVVVEAAPTTSIAEAALLRGLAWTRRGARAVGPWSRALGDHAMRPGSISEA